MKKIKLLIIISILTILLPLKTNAETYYVHLGDRLNVDILESGDILDFTESSYSSPYSKKYKYYISIDGQQPTDDCYGVEDVCLQQYVVQERIINTRIYDRESNDEWILPFLKMNNDDEIITITMPSTIDPQGYIENYYKSGDIIKLVHTNNLWGYYSIYDEQDNVIDSHSFDSYTPVIIRLPKLNGKDVYWANHILLPGGLYNFPYPSFIPIDYNEPKLELKCDKDKLNYGEKTSCKLCMTSYYNMRNISFSFNDSQLKISNIQLSDNIQNNGDGNNIVLAINQPTNSGEEIVLMRFEVEGAIEDSYLDSIELDNIEYEDDVITGNYDSLNSQINIISEKSNTITNPETGVKGLFIILPLFLLLVSMIINQRIKKETTN